MPTYSLSSGTRPACSIGRTKRVSAQLSHLVGSRSRASSEDSQRGVSEDGRGLAACSIDNRKSKAAAWMWYMRSIGDAHEYPAAGAAVSTVQPDLAMNASRIKNSNRELVAATQSPSRFQQEAHACLVSDQAASTSLLGAAHDSQCSAKEPPSVSSVNHLYDELELSRLHELLDLTDKLHSKLSALAPAPCHPSTTLTTLTPPGTSRQSKPLSALHKFFKVLYTKVHSAIETGRRPPSAGRLAPKQGSMQHVIHHHHHHYHHYRRSSLDLPARDESPSCEFAHLDHQALARRRRRHSYQACSQAQDVDCTMKVDQMG